MTGIMVVVAVLASLAGAALVLGLTVVLEGHLEVPIVADVDDAFGDEVAGRPAA